jgi:hypothetical protein
MPGHVSMRGLPTVMNIPSPPIVIPSETPIVLYCHASMLSFKTCFLISFPRSNTILSSVYRIEAMLLSASFASKACVYSRCMLHTISIVTTSPWVHLLAWIAFPPDACNAHMRLCLHCFP